MITLATLIAIAALNRKGVKGDILWSILGGTIIYYVLGFTVPDFYKDFSFGTLNPLSAFNNFAHLSFGLMTYIAVKLLTDKSKKIGINTWIIALLFIAMFFLTH